MRRSLKRFKGLNRRFRSLSFRKLRITIEYKADLNGIGVKTNQEHFKNMQ
ncbi:hypothetical protein DRO56_02685 [Candidatus Bathyarchaeota archaeon]|nr:MAG: hypothetical protein DRO56_02685 [Candidatus Bathyarchaeota archaeon]